MKTIRVLVISAALALTACAELGTQPVQIVGEKSTQSQTGAEAQRAVFIAKSDFLAAVTVVANYRKLPACGAAGVIICKAASIEKRLQSLSNAANDALNEAEHAVRTPGFAVDQLITLETSATAAVKALSSITTTLKTR